MNTDCIILELDGFKIMYDYYKYKFHYVNNCTKKRNDIPLAKAIVALDHLKSFVLIETHGKPKEEDDTPYEVSHHRV